jgi:hypothetical protein
MKVSGGPKPIRVVIPGRERREMERWRLLIVLSFVVSYAESVNRRGDVLQRNTLFRDTLFAVPLMAGFFVFVSLLQGRINCSRHESFVSTMESRVSAPEYFRIPFMIKLPVCAFVREVFNYSCHNTGLDGPV